MISLAGVRPRLDAFPSGLGRSPKIALQPIQLAYFVSNLRQNSFLSMEVLVPGEVKALEKKSQAKRGYIRRDKFLENNTNTWNCIEVILDSQW